LLVAPSAFGETVKSSRSFQVSGNLSSALEGAKLFLTLRTPEGYHKILLTARPGFQTASKYGAVLYRGRLTNVRGAKRVAASVIGNTLFINFTGKQNRRYYEFRVRLSGARSLKVAHVPGFFRLPCGARIDSLSLGGDTVPALSQSVPNQQFVQRVLEISTDADREFYLYYRAFSGAVIQALLNNVETIYLSQLGISFDLIGQHQFSQPGGQPYDSTDPTDLLYQFRSYTLKHAHLPPSDVYHLFTGKKLNGSVIGLAFVGSVCASRAYAYGITQKVNPAIQALVAAHEIGHSLGANHPEEVIPAPAASLMTGIVRSDHTAFSEFSINEIHAHLEAHDAERSCLSERQNARLFLTANTRRTISNLRVLVTNIESRVIQSNCEISIRASERLAKLNHNPFSSLELYRGPANQQIFELQAASPLKRGQKKTNLYMLGLMLCDGIETARSQISQVKVPLSFRKALMAKARKVR